MLSLLAISCFSHVARCADYSSRHVLMGYFSKILLIGLRPIFTERPEGVEIDPTLDWTVSQGRKSLPDLGMRCWLDALLSTLVVCQNRQAAER